MITFMEFVGKIYLLWWQWQGLLWKSAADLINNLCVWSTGDALEMELTQATTRAASLQSNDRLIFKAAQSRNKTIVESTTMHTIDTASRAVCSPVTSAYVIILGSARMQWGVVASKSMIEQ